MKILKNIGLAILLVLSNTSFAALVKYGLVNQEDLLITLDTQTGLEWLALTATQNTSYQEILSGFGSYTTTHGFRVATKNEVNQLFQNVGVTNEWADIPDYVQGVSSLFLFFGILTEIDYNSPRTQYQSHGMYLPDQPCCSASPGVSTFSLTYEYLNPVSGRAYLNNGYTNFDSSFNYRGTFLVREAKSSFPASELQPTVLVVPSIAYQLANCPEDTNGSTQDGIDLVKAIPANYGLFTQAQLDAAKQNATQSCPACPSYSCPVCSCPINTQAQLDTAKQSGIDLVKTAPANYGLFTQAQLDTAKQSGIDLVKTAPANYGLFIQAQLDTAKQSGIDLVKTTPTNYGLFTQAQVDAIKQTSIALVTTAPSNYGLFNQAQIDSAKQAGVQDGINQCKGDPNCKGSGISQAQLDEAVNAAKQSCKANPASCGLFSQAELDSSKELAKQEGINQCKLDPTSCGIKLIDKVAAPYLTNDLKLMIPFLEYQTTLPTNLWAALSFLPYEGVVYFRVEQYGVTQ